MIDQGLAPLRDLLEPKATATALARHIDLYPPVEIEIDLHDERAQPDAPRDLGADLGAGSLCGGHPKGVGLHCLRHYFATLLIHNGASVKTVQPALEHAEPTIPLDTYVGEWPEAHGKTRAIVADPLGDVPRMCPLEASGG